MTFGGNDQNWEARFRTIHGEAVRQYRAGERDLGSYFTEDDRAFLHSIGAMVSELYDFAEDYPDLDLETALAIAAVRREYFLQEQSGVRSDKTVPIEAFPAKNAERNGIPWLPRILLKAKARLRGELPPDLMYCCGGDRQFLQTHQLDAAGFLRLVWDHWDDEDALVAKVARETSAESL